MSSYQHERAENSIKAALEEVKYNVADGRVRSLVYTKLEEALLWLNSDETLKDLA